MTMPAPPTIPRKTNVYRYISFCENPLCRSGAMASLQPTTHAYIFCNDIKTFFQLHSSPPLKPFLRISARSRAFPAIYREKPRRSCISFLIERASVATHSVPILHLFKSSSVRIASCSNRHLSQYDRKVPLIRHGTFHALSHRSLPVSVALCK